MNVKAGQVFSVPLTKRRFLPVLVTKVANRCALIYAFPFESKSAHVLDDLPSLSSSDSILYLVCDSTPMAKGEWEFVGAVSAYNKKEWPMPWFLKRDPLIDSAWRVKLSENDFLRYREKEYVPFDCSDYPEDQHYGSEVAVYAIKKAFDVHKRS